MKEIIAIIRPNKVNSTKDALDKLGLPSMTAEAVLGRGKQRGIAGEVNCEIPTSLMGKSGGMKYIPKRLIRVMVTDADVDSVVQLIIKINQTAQVGDGKIFICPIDDAVRVRTGETGNNAVK